MEELDNYYYPIKKLDREKINVKIFNLSEINAPVQKNSYIGKLCVYNDKEKILELTISTKKSIEKLKFIDYLKNFIINNIKNMENAI